MQGLFFEPSGYFDHKLKERDKKKGSITTNSKFKLQRASSAKSAYSTPSTPTTPSSSHRGVFKSNQSTSSLTSSPIPTLNKSRSNMYQPHHPSTHHNHHHNKSKHRKRSGSGGSIKSSSKSSKSSKASKQSKSSKNGVNEDVFEAYKKKLKRKKQIRSRSMNSSGVQTLLSIEKERITKDKFSRLFHDFESTKSAIDKSERDQLFRHKLASLNKEKLKNKATSFELIRQYFTSILDKKYSNHPLALLITKFCNLFHGQYSFSPEDFKNKSIYQIVDQKRLRRKGNKRSTTDIFDDSGNNKNQSKVVRKTSKRLDRATEDVKSFISKLRSLIITLYPELKILRTYKYVVQSVFHKELFSQLTPTLGDLYSIKTEDKQSEFAKYMGMWQNLSCKDFGASQDFIKFCLITSLRPPLINNDEKKDEDDHDHDDIDDDDDNDNDDGTTEEEVNNDDNDNITESKQEMSGLSKQLQETINKHKMSDYSQLDPVNDDEEEKESEIIHNAEPIDDDIDDIDNNNKQSLTQQTLKAFDSNYAISQLLNESGCLHSIHDKPKDNNLNNANFTIPEYVGEYNIEEDDDDESFGINIENISNGSYNPNDNDNDTDNILPILSPTASSLSSVEYSNCDNIQSSPDSSIPNSDLTYPSKMDSVQSIQSILPQINDEMASKTVEEKKKKSRISSIFNAFSSKKKNNNKKQRSNSMDVKIKKYDKYETMNTASKIIEKTTINTTTTTTTTSNISPRKKGPQLHITMNNKNNNMNNNNNNKQNQAIKPPIINMKSPKINITPQNEHQENHPTPPSKKRYKDNITNITKQMLAGSHAGRIANQLHNINNRRATVHIDENINKSNIINKGNRLCGIEEIKISKSLSKSLTNELNFKNPPMNTESKKEINVETEEDDIESKENVENIENIENMENNEEEYYENPYLTAVLEIKKMPQFDTPEDKIQCVVRTADIIRDCIDIFYENRRVDPIEITPDDLLSLFAYILVQANLHCLWAEVDLIDDFVVDNLRMDMPGYYIATLRAAMQLIVNDIEKLTKTSIKKRNSMKAL